MEQRSVPYMAMMKKKIMIIGLFVAMSLMFTACGSDDGSAEDMDLAAEEAYEEEYEDPMAYLREEVIESEEMAAVYGGIFVKSDEDYSACSPVNSKTSPVYVTDPSGSVAGSCYVPTLDRSKDKLVVFTDQNMGSGKAVKVEDIGYTIPLFGWYAEYSAFSDEPGMSFQITDHAYEFAPEFYEEAMEAAEDYEGDEDEEYVYEDDEEYGDESEYESVDAEIQQRIDAASRHLETINGKTPLELYNEGSVVKGEKQFEDRDWWDVLIPFEQGEEVTLGYRDGSTYEEVVLKAEAKGFMGKSMQTLELIPEKASYVSYDISGLDAGTYVFEYHGHGFAGYYAVNIK